MSTNCRKGRCPKDRKFLRSRPGKGCRGTIVVSRAFPSSPVQIDRKEEGEQADRLGLRLTTEDGRKKGGEKRDGPSGLWLYSSEERGGRALLRASQGARLCRQGGGKKFEGGGKREICVFCDPIGIKGKPAQSPPPRKEYLRDPSRP